MKSTNMTSQKSKKVTAIVLTAALALGSAACQSSSASESSGKTTITFALWDEIQSSTYQKIIDKFTEQHPDIQVEMQLTPWDQYWTKFDASAGANQAPDTFWINTYAPKYADAGILEPLDDYMEKDNIDQSQWLDAVTEAFYYEDELYAVPKGVDSCAVVYNKALFEKYKVSEPSEGWTWEDLKQIANQLKENIDAAGGSEYGVVLPVTDQNSFIRSYIYQAGGSFLNESMTKGNFYNEKTVAALEDVYSLIEKGICPSASIIQENAPIDLLLSGKACLTYTTQNNAKKMNESSLAKDLALVTLPSLENSSYVPAVMGYGMNAQGKHKEASWEFLKFLGGEEANQILAEDGADMPAYIDAQQYYATGFEQLDVSAFERQLQNVIPIQLIPVRDKVNSEENEIFAKIFTGELSVTDGLKQLDEVNNEALDTWYSKH